MEFWISHYGFIYLPLTRCFSCFTLTTLPCDSKAQNCWRMQLHFGVCSILQNGLSCLTIPAFSPVAEELMWHLHGTQSTVHFVWSSLCHRQLIFLLCVAALLPTTVPNHICNVL